MNKMCTFSASLWAMLLSATIVTGCQAENEPTPEQLTENTKAEQQTTSETDKKEEPSATAPDSNGQTGTSTPAAGISSNPSSNSPNQSGESGSYNQVSAPESISVLVNKQNKLPDQYKPKDLVYPDVPFVFSEKIEKRMMRAEAAGALEKMFAAAKQDGVALAGVSAYRSNATQTALFNRYAQKDGIEAARKYSAEPGHSEHETGLSIDVSGSTGECAAQDCFGGTEEAIWLEQNSWKHGFVIRYPKGKEAITGYQYEPWHIRYVGEENAKAIQDRGITLEEFSESPTAFAP
ncbi:M15 family metallopeptidase [Brevibacillus daliensis]|uniref:M15 family metallopeptidase n=1 Tax=Brevibacillus daliensis TaxID=2892995 RepID=UPI001E50DAAE|nr:M15 family metallopeptidase [Brevibacillus daliensis]